MAQHKTKYDNFSLLNLILIFNLFNRDWIQFLPLVAATYNMTPQSTIRATPFELYHGRRAANLISSVAPSAKPLVEWTTAEYEQYQTEMMQRVCKILPSYN